MSHHCCPSCREPIEARPDGRFPPWCSKCGSDFSPTSSRPTSKAVQSIPSAREATAITADYQAIPVLEPAPAPQEYAMMERREWRSPPPLPSEAIVAEFRREMDRSSYSRDEEYDPRPLPPYFETRYCQTWKANRCLRIYITAEELLFLDAGPTDINQTQGQGFAWGGLIGLVIGGMIADNRRKEAEARRADLKRADLRELRYLAREESTSFRARPEDLLDVRLEALTFWQRIGHWGTNCTGLLKFHHRDRGPYSLELATLEDMRRAMDLLPPVLGERFHLNAKWSHAHQRFDRLPAK